MIRQDIFSRMQQEYCKQIILTTICPLAYRCVCGATIEGHIFCKKGVCNTPLHAFSSCGLITTITFLGNWQSRIIFLGLFEPFLQYYQLSYYPDISQVYIFCKDLYRFWLFHSLSDNSA
jgi:hypothetical protein